MSDAADTPSREEEMLARLAELDLAAAEKAHGKLMAAEESAEIAELGRTYQRLARSLRQTLALKARLAREREAAKAPPKPGPASGFPRPDRLTPAVRAHIDRVRAAVMPFIEREDEACDHPELYQYELQDILIDLAAADDFLSTSIEDLVLDVVDILGISIPPETPPEPAPAVDNSA